MGQEGLSGHVELLFPYVQLGTGINRIKPLTQAAAGGPLTYKCDPSYYEIITSLIFTYTADATVGSRVLSALFTGPDGETLAIVPAIGTLAASGAATVFMSPGNKSTLGAVPGSMAIWLPRQLMQPGWAFQLTATNQGPGDTITAAYAQVQSYATDWASGTDEADWRRHLAHVLRALESAG